MGQAHRAPREYTRKHIITTHALERFREYANDLATATQDGDLWNMLDEAISTGLSEAEKYLGQENTETWMMPFERPMWVDLPVYFVLVDDQVGKTGKKVLKTVLTENAFQHMLNKAKLIPWATAQETAALAQEDAEARKLSLELLPPYDQLHPTPPPAPLPAPEEFLLVELVESGCGFRVVCSVREDLYQRAILKAVLDGADSEKLVLFKKHGVVSLNISLK